MATSLNIFKSVIQTAWEALGYNFIDTLIDERGNGQHKQILWARATNVENADVETQRWWTLSCTLFLHRNDRTLDLFMRDVDDTKSDLIKTFNAINSLGANVLGAVLLGVTEEADDESVQPTAGGIRRGLVTRVVFTFRVLTQEA